MRVDTLLSVVAYIKTLGSQLVRRQTSWKYTSWNQDKYSFSKWPKRDSKLVQSDWETNTLICCLLVAIIIISYFISPSHMSLSIIMSHGCKYTANMAPDGDLDNLWTAVLNSLPGHYCEKCQNCQLRRSTMELWTVNEDGVGKTIPPSYTKWNNYCSGYDLQRFTMTKYVTTNCFNHPGYSFILCLFSKPVKLMKVVQTTRETFIY